MDTQIIVTRKTNTTPVIIQTDDEVVNLILCADKLVSAQRNNKICIWTKENSDDEYTLLQTLKAHEAPVICFDYSRDLHMFASGSADSSVKIWDLHTLQCYTTFKGHTGLITSVKFHPSNRLFFSADSFGKILCHSIESKKTIALFNSHSSVVKVIEFINDTTLMSIGRDQVINLWSLKTNNLLTSFPVYDAIEGGGHLSISTKEMTSLFVYTAGQQGEFKLYRLEGMEFTLVQTIEICKDGIVDLSRNGNQLDLVAVDHNIHSLTFDTDTNQFIQSGIRCGFNDELFDVKYVDETENFVVATNSTDIKYYKANNLTCDLVKGHSDVVLCLSVYKDKMLSGSKDNTAILWRLVNDRFEIEMVLKGHTSSVTACLLEKERLITCSDDRTMKSWTGTECITTLVHSKQITSIRVSPNGKMIATASLDKLVKLWNVKCELIGELKGHKRGVNGIEFSPVEMCLVSGGSDGLVKLWNVKTFQCLKTFEGHLNSVINCKFVKLGLSVLSAGSDGLIKCFNIKSGVCEDTIDAHDDKIWAIDTCSQGFISVGADSKILLWTDCTQENTELKRVEEADKIKLESDLQVFLERGDYKSAMLIALDAQKTFKLVGIVKCVLELETADLIIRDFCVALTSDQTRKLWICVRDWNTSAKYAKAAQKILFVMLELMRIDDVCDMEGIADIIEGLIAYTSKHQQRAKKESQNAHLVGFTVEMMDGI